MEIKPHLVEIVGMKSVSEATHEQKKIFNLHTLKEAQFPIYIVSPTDTQQIQKIILLANEKRVPVFPLSSQIHLYDTIVPPKDSIVLNLSGMNRIIKIDERNRMAQIEAGVTWPQLQSELERRNLMAMSPLIPHTQKSVVTSYLEREPIVIPKHEYGDPLLTMEFVYPTGKIMRTGSAIVPGFGVNAISDGVFPAGPGIDHWRLLQGAQGTLGVVTWANVKVEYLPEVNKVFFIPFKIIDDAIDPLYQIQRRMIGLECFLLNNLNLSCILSNGTTGDIDKLKETLSEWILILVLGGGRRHAKSKIKYEQEVLAEISRVFSLKEIMTELPNLSNNAEKKLLKILRNCSQAGDRYWKYANQKSCEDIFFLTTLDKVQTFMTLLKKVIDKYKVSDVGLYIQPIEYGRACHFECNIFYDSSDSGQVENTKRLFQDLAQSFIQKGAFFSRPYGILADLVLPKAKSYSSILKKIKAFYDPYNILSPGKLCFK